MKCPWVQTHETPDPMAGTFSAHYYHLVFSTKARAHLITGEIEPRLYEYIGGIIRSEGGHLIKIGGVEDHIHLLVSLGPKHCLSDLVRVVKSKAIRWVKETSPLWCRLFVDVSSISHFDDHDD